MPANLPLPAPSPYDMGTLLVFRDPALEKGYRLHHARLHWRADVANHALGAVLWAIVAWRDPLASTKALAGLGSAASAACLWLALRRPARYTCQRERIITALGVAGAALGALMGTVEPPAVPTPQSWGVWLFYQLVTYNKVVVMWVVGLGCALPFCAHLTSSTAMLLILLAADPRLCARFEHLHPGSSAKYSAAYEALGTVFSTPAALVAGRRAHAPAFPHCSCMVVQAFVRTVLGVLGPAGLVYWLDVKARCRFQLAQSGRLHSIPPPAPLLVLPFMIAVSTLWYAVLLVEHAALVWQQHWPALGHEVA